jgi:hypothetical protein
MTKRTMTKRTNNDLQNTDNTMTKRTMTKRTNNGLPNTTYKTKD